MNMTRTRPEHLSLCKCSECPLSVRKETKLSKLLAEYGVGTYTRILGIEVGDPNYPHEVVVVGIYPAKDEVNTGEPFTGKSGSILRSVLDQLGYKRYYLTNVLLCEVPEHTDSTDIEQAIQCCSERLDAEIRCNNPDLVIVLGNVPLAATVEGHYKITEVAGRVREG